MTKPSVLAIGHELRLSSLWGKVKEMIVAGAVGEPLYVLIELWRRPYRFGSGGWRYDTRRVGNWALEEPIHFFDLARWYFARSGDPASVYGTPDIPDSLWQLSGLSAAGFVGGKVVRLAGPIIDSVILGADRKLKVSGRNISDSALFSLSDKAIPPHTADLDLRALMQQGRATVAEGASGGLSRGQYDGRPRARRHRSSRGARDRRRARARATPVDRGGDGDSRPARAGRIRPSRA